MQVASERPAWRPNLYCSLGQGLAQSERLVEVGGRPNAPPGGIAVLRQSEQRGSHRASPDAGEQRRARCYRSSTQHFTARLFRDHRAVKGSSCGCGDKVFVLATSISLKSS